MTSKIKFVLSLLLALATTFSYGYDKKELRERLPRYIKSQIGNIETESLNGIEPDCKVSKVNENCVKVSFDFYLDKAVNYDDWGVNITPSFVPEFNWVNHITPAEGNVADQHSFRTPAMIVQNGNKTLIVIPDVEKIGVDDVHWYMDMDAGDNVMRIGMSRTLVTDHVLWSKTPGAVYDSGHHSFGFYIMAFDSKDVALNPFRPVLSFFWNRWGHNAFKDMELNHNLFMKYCERTYDWAFNNWKDAVWQEFDIDGKNVGAPVFIVNMTQSPNYKGPVNEREFRSIWNQAWFNSLRSASGLYRYAKLQDDAELLMKANLTKNLALSFPNDRGLFYGLIATPMELVEDNGKLVNRSVGWDHYYWGNSNRNPYTSNPADSPFHILDMSCTAYYMLKWYTELEQDPALLEYVVKYADALLSLQTEKGYFPAWIDTKTYIPYDELTVSPETSMSVTMLMDLYNITKNEKYKDAALKAMDAVINDIIYQGRWEDFETYFSCCRIGTPYLIGKKVQRNNMYKQCNFSMYWTAQALLECYKLSGKKSYLDLGLRTLDEMLMTQASWQPPYMYVDVVGGFGVMNADGEWNDSRQSLFAPLLLEYYDVVSDNEYKERALAALKISFQMMYCPENPRAEEQWKKAWPFIGEEDYGFMMENYGHGGAVSPDGLGIGEFNIYDWGNGSATEAYLGIFCKYGDKIFE